MKTKSGKHTNLFKRLCLSAAVALLCALFTLAAAATDGSSSASGKTYVHDLAGLLSDSERASLEAKLKDVSSRTGIDVGLLTDDDYTSDYFSVLSPIACLRFPSGSVSVDCTPHPTRKCMWFPLLLPVSLSRP